MTTSSLSSLSDWAFEDRFVRSLPADTETTNTRRQVFEACYSFVNPRKVAAPQLLAYSPELVVDLSLSPEMVESEQFANVFAGNELLTGMRPHAMCYAGHQFGNWAGQLGDGRVINLGEVRDLQDELQMLQLKGAGETPYSRSADGLAVLRSSIREFLCSEAMFHLGVPTTRALSLVSTGETVMRDMFYDGRPAAEPGAIVCRVAPSFLRFGSYELFNARNDIDNLRKLVDYTIREHFPELGEPNKQTYLAWFKTVCERSADLVVHWMRVGFVHGVLNTDNTSILGLTIDYGPYGWIDDYDPDWTPNTTDAGGKRYRFGHQGQIMQWNCFQLANAIYPLIDDAEPLREILTHFAQYYTQQWQTMRVTKLGLQHFNDETDEVLNRQLHNILQLTETDMTLFYRGLADVDCENNDQSDDALFAPLLPAYYAPDSLSKADKKEIHNWLRQYQKRVQQDGTQNSDRRVQMNQVNPKFVLRNYLSQQVIKAATAGDLAPLHELFDVMRRPYDEQPHYARYAEKRPDWARHEPGCSMLSCSS